MIKFWSAFSPFNFNDRLHVNMNFFVCFGKYYHLLRTFPSKLEHSYIGRRSELPSELPLPYSSPSELQDVGIVVISFRNIAKNIDYVELSTLKKFTLNCPIFFVSTPSKISLLLENRFNMFKRELNLIISEVVKDNESYFFLKTLKFGPLSSPYQIFGLFSKLFEENLSNLKSRRAISLLGQKKKNFFNLTEIFF